VVSETRVGRRFTSDDVRGVCKSPDAWWVVGFSDPLAIRVLPLLMRPRWITPNFLTGASIVLALISGGIFLWGVPIAGAVLFETARFADNLDGKVARLRGMTSLVGGFFDITGDLVRLVWVYSAVGLWLASKHEIPRYVALLPALVVLVWMWSNNQLELKQQGAPTGQVAVDPAARRSWTARHGMNPLPGSIDAAGVALTLAPLSGQPMVMAIVLWVVCGAFYFLASVRNVAKVFRALRARDRAAAGAKFPSGEGAAQPHDVIAHPGGNEFA
jgi:phosphatidylglycerophosphate synthase